MSLQYQLFTWVQRIQLGVPIFDQLVT